MDKVKSEKPEWITERQWEAVPSEAHWLNQKKGEESSVVRDFLLPHYITIRIF
jgi:hypothetical protein